MCFFLELKEYFVSDFNAFIDNAASLDYLEIEIPGQTLDYLRITSDVVHGPVISIKAYRKQKNCTFCISKHLAKNKCKIFWQKFCETFFNEFIEKHLENFLRDFFGKF